jgi:hypothetical protein
MAQLFLRRGAARSRRLVLGAMGRGARRVPEWFPDFFRSLASRVGSRCAGRQSAAWPVGASGFRLITSRRSPFGGLRVDDAVGDAILSPERRCSGDGRRERSQSAVRSSTRSFHARSRSGATDNRLLAGELEARWNKALERMAEVENRIAAHDAAKVRTVAGPGLFGTLAVDFETSGLAFRLTCG